MYRIGEFARIAGVTAKMLRFYDEIGLLKPERTDPATRYRYYAPEQLIALAEILACRDMGLSLAEVAALGRRVSRRVALQRSRERLQCALARVQNSLDRIDAAIASGTHGVPVVIKQRPATRVASLGDVVLGYDDVREAERELLGRVPERLRGRQRGVLWHQCADMGVPGGEPFVEIRASRLDRGCDRLDLKELPAVTVACAYAPDDYEAAERAYDAIRAWMRVRPHTLAGPKRELYHDRTPRGVLEIQFPLMSA
jgi:DNA-binding transcriptional MerR regulator